MVEFILSEEPHVQLNLGVLLFRRKGRSDLILQGNLVGSATTTKRTILLGSPTSAQHSVLVTYFCLIYSELPKGRKQS